MEKTNTVALNANNEKKSVFAKLRKRLTALSCAVFAMCLSVGQAFAAGGGGGDPIDAETMWQKVIDLISTWVGRLGIVIMVIGAVLFGLGWRGDDPTQKSNGINTVIAGGIVLAAMTLLGLAA